MIMMMGVNLMTLSVSELTATGMNLVLLILSLLVVLSKKIVIFLNPSQVIEEDSDGIRVRDSGVAYKASVYCCFYILFLQTVVLCYDGGCLIQQVALGDRGISFEPLLLSISQCLSWCVLSYSAFNCIILALEKFPLLIRSWWIISFTFSLCNVYVYGDHEIAAQGSRNLNIHFLANLVATPALAFLCFVGFRGITGIKVIGGSDHREPLLVEQDASHLQANPYINAGLFSLATFSWLDSLLAMGAKRPLELKDIPLLAPKHRSKFNYKILNSNWEKLKSEDQPSLSLALFRSFWKEAAKIAFFVGLYTLVLNICLYMISDFINYLGGVETFPHEGYVLTGGFFVAKLMEVLLIRQWYFGSDILGSNVKSALCAMVYQKGLRLSSSSRQSHTSSEIVNYIEVDVERVSSSTWYLHDIWSLPMQIILSFVILYKNVGFACIVTFFATILSIAVTVPLEWLRESCQDELDAAKVERIGKTSECLRNMRILKLQAWEDRYRTRLEEMRTLESKCRKKALYSQAITTFFLWSSSSFVAAVTFGASIWIGNQLTVGGVLSALATFRIINQSLQNIPDFLSIMNQTKKSLDRITKFLQEEELQENPTIVLPTGFSNVAIEINDGKFWWDSSVPRPTLSDIEVKVNKGMHVAVCGSAGSGKSSFLSCILGEIPKVYGVVRICGSVAHVSQSSWIHSGNIEENILFGSPMNKLKYKSVLRACSLKKDLELFSNGDQTIIGDGGIDLSSGQKLRLHLARALYQDADIYLLDDLFSAVDAHTASQIFRKYVLTALADKTVVFVTQHTEFLPAADLILILEEGEIIQAGNYDELLQAGIDFSTLVSAHEEAMDNYNHSSEDSDETDSVDSTLHMISTKSESIGSNMEHIAAKVPNEAGASSSDHKALIGKKTAKGSRIKQEDETEQGKNQMQIYLSYMTAAHKGLLVPLIIVAQTLYQVLHIASNWWMAWAVLQTEDDSTRVSGVVLVGVYMAIAFGSSLFVFVRAVLVATFGVAAAQKLFTEMLSNIFRAPMSFFDSTTTEKILNCASVDQDVIDLDIPFRLSGFASTTIQVLTILGLMTQVTWHVLLLLVPTVLACLWMQQYYMASSRVLSHIFRIQKSDITNLLRESVAGAATIQAFGQEKRFMKRKLYLLDCVKRPFLCSIAAIEWFCLRVGLLSTFVYAFCLVILVSSSRDDIDPSMSGLAVLYGLDLDARVSRWMLSLCKLDKKNLSIERIQQYCQIRSEAPTINKAFRPPSLWPREGKIEFINLKVQYKESLPAVLCGITCTFPGGSKIGIVGRAGSGKSTLSKALFRLVEPESGKIVIDNIDISSIGLHDLRSRLSIIPQDPVLFEGTIRGNLDPMEVHTDQEVWEALDKSQLGDIVRENELKLDAPVLKNGDDWSLGQRQLVSLGRALLKQSRILVLEEVVASPDAATSYVIQKIIHREFKDCTVCTITHRIPAVINSDMALVLRDGEVVEFDSVTRLLENKSSMLFLLLTEYSSQSSSMPYY